MVRLLFIICSVFFSSFVYAGIYYKPTNVLNMKSQDLNGDLFYYATDRSGEVHFQVNAPSDGYYRIRAKVLAANGKSDSFYVQLDQRFPALWDIKEGPDVQFATWSYKTYLSKGTHQIKFLARESNTKISELLLNFTDSVKIVRRLDFSDKQLQSNFLGDLDSTNIDCPQSGSETVCNWDRKELAKIKRDFITGKPVLEVSYPPVSIGTPRVTFNKKLPINSNDYTLSYRVKFGAHYRWAKGGKMHGLGPAKPTTGCQPRTDDGWSVRMLTMSTGRLAIYVYDQDRNNPNGCGEGFTAPNFRITNTEKWYNISLYVKLNSPNRADGVAKLFVDGKQIHEVTGLRLRRSNAKSSLMQNFMFNTFYGGGSWDAAPDRTTHVQFSDFQIAEGEVPRVLSDTKIAADYSASEIKKLLREARDISVPVSRDRGVKTDFGKYPDSASADFDLETGVSSNWKFGSKQRYNGYFLRSYAELFIKVGQLFSETTGTTLPKASFEFHSKDGGQIGYQLESSTFRSYSYSQDPNQIIKHFLVDLIYVTNFVNPSQRNGVRSINVEKQSLASSFSQLNHRAFRHKSPQMYIPQLLRRSANLFLQEEKHYKSNPIGSAENFAQTSIDLKVDNFGSFQYLPPYSGHKQSGVRSFAGVESWSYSSSSKNNKTLAQAYGQFLIELHDIHRLFQWHGDPTVEIKTRSLEPTKQFKVGSKPWRKFKSNIHPRTVFQQMVNDY